VTETVDDLSPLGTKGRRAIAVAKTAVVVLGIVASGVAGIVATYRAASARDRADAGTKEATDLTRGNYKAVAPSVNDHEKRIHDLEETVRQLVGQQHPPARRGSKPRAPAPMPPPPKPVKTLPPDLDRAIQQATKSPAPPAAPPAGDGGAAAERGR
jgi:hypothetical protein